MKKTFLTLALALLAPALFAVDAANDLILTQRKSDNSGNIQRNATGTANALVGFTSGSVATSTLTPSVTSITLSSLTSGRVPFSTTAGLLTDDSAFTYNGSTDILTAAGFTSTVATGTAPLVVASTTLVANLHAATADTSTTTTNATNIGITNDNSTNATMYPMWVTATTGNLAAKVSSTQLTFNPSTDTLGVADGFSVSSAGSIALAAGGASKNITISATGMVIFPGGVSLPTATGFTFQIGSRNAAEGVATTPQLMFRRTNTSAASPSNVTNGQGLGTIIFKGYAATQYSGTAAEITVNSTQDWTDSANGAELNFWTTVNGQITEGVGPKLKIGNYGKITFAPAAGSQAAWGVLGALFSQNGTTVTDSSSATGTVASAVFNSFGAPTINATNASVVYTDLFNLYAVAPLTTGNASATRAHTLGVIDSTSATSSITGGLIVATTVGTAATSVGIGGGNINAGGTITAGTSLSAATTILSSGATSGIGYTAGAGGAVTQATDKTTAVTLNTVTGAITMAGTALAAGTSVGFTVNDSAVATLDYVGCSIDSAATLNSYTVTVDSIGAGTFHIHLRNESAGSLSEAIVLRFVLIKTVSS